MLIDDDKSFLKIICNRLNKKWFTTYVWHTIECKLEEVDIFIIDLHLSDLSFPLIERAHKTKKPIIILSWYRSNNFVEKSLRNWATVFLDKTISSEILYLQIINLLNIVKCDK